jgi:N-acetylglutamate synthase-like GNAT family acetyltransferase
MIMLRKARPEDVPIIRALIDDNLDKLLPRTEDEIFELLPTFWVAEEGGEIVGCCCLEVYSPKIAEIRSLAVREGYRGQGHGAELVKAATDEAHRRKIQQVFVVTSAKEYFEGLHFGPFLGEKYILFWNGAGADDST